MRLGPDSDLTRIRPGPARARQVRPLSFDLLMTVLVLTYLAALLVALQVIILYYIILYYIILYI